MLDMTQRLLLKLPPEIAHEVAILGLRLFGHLPGPVRPHTTSKRTLFGCEFANPIGLAAGLDTVSYTHLTLPTRLSV